MKVHSVTNVLCRLAVMWCCGVAVATAGPIGIVNLHSLAAQSDAIVVGTIVQGLQRGHDISFALLVNRVLKGSVNVSETLTVQWTTASPYNGSRDLKGGSGLYFLQKPATGAWQLLPAMAGDAVLELAVLPATVMSVASDLMYAAETPIDEKMLLELAAAIENKQGGYFAVNYLTGLELKASPAASRVYHRFSVSSSADLSAYGIAGLLRQGDAGVLAALSSASPTLQAGSSGDLVANSLCQYSNANPLAVAALGALSVATQAIPRVQFCTAAALRMIHTVETLPWLGKLLDSKSADVRYEAVAGLASFANSGAIPRESPMVIDGVVTPRPPNPFKNSQTLENFPAIDTFHLNEAKYITFWKSWLQSQALQ
jgi:hypothetical protein